MPPAYFEIFYHPIFRKKDVLRHPYKGKLNIEAPSTVANKRIQDPANQMKHPLRIRTILLDERYNGVISKS